MGAEYIKREDAIRSIADHDEFKGERWIKEAWADYLIENAKPADVAPVRHGHWIEEQDRIVCSECGARFKDEIIYMQENKPGAPHRCLECGAIMDQEVPTNG